jgi:hypothetical protein
VVGTRVTSRPPPRTVRAAFPHTAPTSGINGSSLPYASQQQKKSMHARSLAGSSMTSLTIATIRPSKSAPLISRLVQRLISEFLEWSCCRNLQLHLWAWLCITQSGPLRLRASR